MHNLFLGEVLHHCRRVWGIDVAQDKQPAAPKLAQHTLEDQQKILDKIFVATCLRAEKKLVAIRKDYLSAVARFNNIVGTTSSELTKQDLASALLDWNDPKMLRLPPTLNDPAARFWLPADEPPPETSADIQATTLPSWLESPPSNFGSAAHGKLKADLWRTVATVNLVITTVRLWGAMDTSPEEQEVLQNFVHLISAVTLATRRSMTLERAASYDYHMQRYLRGLRSLFDHKLVPNHHLSLHLRPLLELFGPVHGWWAFPFERYNGILQRMNTNSRASDMPATFMRSWYMGSNIRWLMRTTEWPDEPPYGDMIKTFETAFRDRVRGTRVTDILNVVQNRQPLSFSYDPKRAVLLIQDVYESLLRCVNLKTAHLFCSAYSSSGTKNTSLPLAPSGQPVSSIEHDGIRFSAATAPGARDSYVTFRSPTGSVLAGQISQIFYHQRAENGAFVVEPFLIVRAFKSLSEDHAILNPYRRFPDLDTQLVYNEFETRPHVISLNQLVSHFAHYTYTPAGIEEECVVVRSLDRVHGPRRSFCSRTDSPFG
ncbi:hypothetical protein C8Q78DRAFT_1072989 [Trametes maxima]|nr:hypothetical protein C8Q78DRAFT_1072989 [Trametes maxima]